MPEADATAFGYPYLSRPATHTYTDTFEGFARTRADAAAARGGAGRAPSEGPRALSPRRAARRDNADGGERGADDGGRARAAPRVRALGAAPRSTCARSTGRRRGARARARPSRLRALGCGRRARHGHAAALRLVGQLVRERRATRDTARARVRRRAPRRRYAMAWGARRRPRRRPARAVLPLPARPPVRQLRARQPLARGGRQRARRPLPAARRRALRAGARARRRALPARRRWHQFEQPFERTAASTFGPRRASRRGSRPLKHGLHEAMERAARAAVGSAAGAALARLSARAATARGAAATRRRRRRERERADARAPGPTPPSAGRTACGSAARRAPRGRRPAADPACRRVPRAWPAQFVEEAAWDGCGRSRGFARLTPPAMSAAAALPCRRGTSRASSGACVPD